MLPIGFYVALFFLLGAMSFLYKENLWFRVVEYTLVGGGIADALVFSVNAIRVQGVNAVLRGNWIMIIPLILGAIVLTRLVRGVEFASNWPIAMAIGVGTALSVRGYVSANVTAQLSASIGWAFARSATPMSLANGLMTAVFAICALVFFTFSREHKGLLGWMSKIGKFVIMIGFGVNATSVGQFFFNIAVTKIEQILATLGLLPV